MSDPVAMISAFIAEVNGGNIPTALARLTDDVCIVEDLAPFRWVGAEAGGKWLAAMAANGERMGVTHIVMTPGEPRRVEVEGDHAYCIIPGRVTLEGPEVSLAEEGLLTFVTRWAGDEWRISAFTWTGTRAEAV